MAIRVDFQSLHKAVRPHREPSKRERETHHEKTLRRRREALQPTRVRAFRWQVIPAIYCIFVSALIAYVTSMIAGGVAVRGAWFLYPVLLILMLVAAALWLRRWWIVAVPLTLLSVLIPFISML